MCETLYASVSSGNTGDVTEDIYKCTIFSVSAFPTVSIPLNIVSILPLCSSTLSGQTLASLMIQEEYIEKLLWFSVFWLWIVYWVCLIALCPNKTVQAVRARVYRDGLCCELSHCARNIHSTHGFKVDPFP